MKPQDITAVGRAAVIVMRLEKWVIVGRNIWRRSLPNLYFSSSFSYGLPLSALLNTNSKWWLTFRSLDRVMSEFPPLALCTIDWPASLPVDTSL
jgi:hypothetical protein